MKTDTDNTRFKDAGPQMANDKTEEEMRLGRHIKLSDCGILRKYL